MDAIGVERRRAQQVIVYAHDLAGALDCPPQSGWHFQNFFRRIRLRDPGADLVVLIRCQQSQVQHLVNGFHGLFGLRLSG